MKTRMLIAIAAAGTLLLAACGGGGDAGSDGGGGGDGAASSTVTMRDNEFVPADIVISAGEVDLVNEGAAPHTFTVEDESVDVQVDGGETATTTVDLAAGTYTVFCSFHRAQGMEATLTVEA
ncbi:MAG TPA: cupredoxin domain-containing protein [Actinomycetota bacterium]|nr:cupredoxin domain-containing protein [Actinomycetota bacterium]